MRKRTWSSTRRTRTSRQKGIVVEFSAIFLMAVSCQQSAERVVVPNFFTCHKPPFTEKRKLRTEAFISVCPMDSVVSNGTALRREFRLASRVY